MNKLVFADVDGTVLPMFERKIPESTIDAFRDLQRNGVGVILCTGRHMCELEKLGLLDFPYDGFVTLNGQICLDSERSAFFRSPIRGRSKKALLSMFDKREVPVLLAEEDRIYVNFRNKYADDFAAAAEGELYPVDEYDGGKIYMASVFSDTVDLPEDARLICDRWSNEAMDIYSSVGGKVSGIRRFQRRFGVRKKDVITFGDGENDMEMLKYAGTGVAMGNAISGVKECADYVTCDSADGGIAKALKDLGLI